MDVPISHSFPVATLLRLVGRSKQFYDHIGYILHTDTLGPNRVDVYVVCTTTTAGEGPPEYADPQIRIFHVNLTLTLTLTLGSADPHFLVQKQICIFLHFAGEATDTSR